MTALMYTVKDDKLDFVVEELIINKDCLNLNLVNKNEENVVFHALCNPNASTTFSMNYYKNPILMLTM